jgi:transcriptional regulator with XRE-family HTH domain
MYFMAMQIFKIIRQKLGWTRYKMAKELGISQTQYDYLEQKAVNAAIKTLLKLQEVSERELLMPLQEFWGLLKRKR